MSVWQTVGALWLVWVASWFVASVWTNATDRRPKAGQEWGYRLVTFAGAIMMIARERPLAHFDLQPALAWSLVFAIFCGFAWAWWARIHLGRMWSSSVTKKAGHRIIDTGPYGIVRHPIYTGLILSLFATAMLEDQIVAFVGAATMTLGFWMKARLEERLLREELGWETYDAYRRRVPMLVPFGPKSA